MLKYVKLYKNVIFKEKRNILSYIYIVIVDGIILDRSRNVFCFLLMLLILWCLYVLKFFESD